MTRAIVTIAVTTFRESIRNRTLLAILFLALAFIASAVVLAKLALDQKVRVITDWGLFCVSAFGVLLAILMGVSLMQKEVRRKTLYVVLTRPIARWQYVAGKYLGLAATLLAEVGLLSVAMLALLWIEGVSPGWLVLKALYLSMLEILMVAAVAVFFAAFSSPYLSGLFTLGIFVVGRSIPHLIEVIEKIDVAVPYYVFKSLFFLLPDFASFNVSTQAVHGLDISWAETGILTAYSCGYLVLVLFFASWVFSRRNLT